MQLDTIVEARPEPAQPLGHEGHEDVRIVGGNLPNVILRQLQCFAPEIFFERISSAIARRTAPARSTRVAMVRRCERSGPMVAAALARQHEPQRASETPNRCAPCRCLRSRPRATRPARQTERTDCGRSPPATATDGNARRAPSSPTARMRSHESLRLGARPHGTVTGIKSSIERGIIERRGDQRAHRVGNTIVGAVTPEARAPFQEQHGLRRQRLLQSLRRRRQAMRGTDLFEHDQVGDRELVQDITDRPLPLCSSGHAGLRARHADAPTSKRVRATSPTRVCRVRGNRPSLGSPCYSAAGFSFCSSARSIASL